MDLLLKRQQNRGFLGRVKFHLWAKLEMDQDERALLDRYDLDAACLIDGDDFSHLKSALILTVFAFFPIAGLAFAVIQEIPASIPIGVLGAIACGFVWFNEKRETIYVKDLLYGRRFKCRSIVDLARKEAMLDFACTAMRQVLETAKHWDGVESLPIPVLPKDEAKALVAKLG